MSTSSNQISSFEVFLLAVVQLFTYMMNFEEIQDYAEMKDILWLG